MIESADEFVRLRTSKKPEEYDKAYRSEAPESVWLEIIERYPDMRYWVALNKTSPLSILRILADDDETLVRESVAGRRRLDYQLFDKLSRDRSESVRINIVYNKKTPRDVLEKLCNDPVDWIAEAAQQALSERRGDEAKSGCG